MVNRRVPDDIQELIQRLIMESLIFANDNPGSAMMYMKSYAQEMKEEVLLQHVNTFVNDYSVSLGEEGRKAVMELLGKGSDLGLFPATDENIFVPKHN